MRMLVVDDSRSSLAFLAARLRELGSHEVETMLRPRAALARCDEVQFDLVILDHIMPDMDGIEVTRHLRSRASYSAVPIIMVTSNVESSIRLEAIAAGANDFLPKPFDSVELQARVRNLLELRRAQRQLAEHAARLAAEVEIATRHVVEREEELIWRLARAIEYRDGSTGEHVSRVALLSRLIAESLGLTPERCRIIYLAAPLHDIGKIGIADAILSKPGKLTPAETTAMRTHVTIGARILEQGSSELVRAAELIAQSHHERWDGKGYPEGLAGTDIPIEARIVAVADVFDALCSERPYKPAWPVEAARLEIRRGSGTQFDPRCVAAFEARWPEIAAIFEEGAGPSPPEKTLAGESDASPITPARRREGASGATAA
ncbi:MAG TPA: HD domain-containing phosphohydrolase [Devosiaceae bacterium]|nr:HD domain-containing phosphohydrolase [Devosiaceae bacterium]